MSRFTRVGFKVKCATGEDDKLVVLSHRLVGQGDTEISIRAKTRTNERHDETSEREGIVRYSN